MMIRNYVTFNPKIHKFEPMRKATEKLVKLDEKHPFDLIKRINTNKKPEKPLFAAAGGSNPFGDNDIFNKIFNKKSNNLNTFRINIFKK